MATLPEEFKIENIVHPSYGMHSYKWELIRDSLAGEVAIKKANEKYLPMPSAMTTADAISPSTFNSQLSANHPDYHSNQPYSAYKSRARFPELTDATLRGIIGLILRNPSAYHNLPAPYVAEDITKDGKSLSDLELQIDTEVMAMGRAGLLADPDDTNQPKIVTYAAEDILNWQVNGTGEDIEVSSLLLRDNSETKEFWEPDNDDEYHLLLIINEDGNYEIGRYKNGKLTESVVPTVMGKPLTYIPFVFCGTMDITADIDTAPLWPLANVAKSIYQVSADLRNAQYMSCNPMLTISGLDHDQAPAAIGSSVALILEQYTAKAYYPKTDTTALEHVRMYIKDLQTEAIRMGANLLGNDSTQAESGEAIRLKQSMSSATVASVVATVGKSLERMLNMLADWLNKPITAEVKVNTEFSSFQMTANEQIALVQSWQSGLLSTDTALENFRRAGMLQDGEDSTAELERLQNDAYRDKVRMEQAAAKNASSNSASANDPKGPKGANKDGSLNLPEGSEPNPAVS
jgi:hypothetical protein